MILIFTEFGATFVAAWWLTGRARAVLTRKGVMDNPNERSSHSRPTPRGGGLGVVITFFIAAYVLFCRGSLESDVFQAFLTGGSLIAAVGLLDDLISLPFWLKGSCHISAAVAGIHCLKSVGTLGLGVRNWLGLVVCTLAVVWMTNLYNFMDGIDGIAGIEAVCAGLSGAALLLYSRLGGLAGGAVALAGASAGFLIWNWAPAKIFMGDVGSGFLGYLFGVLLVATFKQRGFLIWPWFILLSAFIADATYTLVRRCLAGEKWHEPHCSHAYQRAARHTGSHAAVTLAFAGINVFWLFPLAACACCWPAWGPLLFVVALAPLVWAAQAYGAGTRTPVETRLKGTYSYENTSYFQRR